MPNEFLLYRPVCSPKAARRAHDVNIAAERPADMLPAPWKHVHRTGSSAYYHMNTALLLVDLYTSSALIGLHEPRPRNHQIVLCLPANTTIPRKIRRTVIISVDMKPRRTYWAYTSTLENVSSKSVYIFSLVCWFQMCHMASWEIECRWPSCPADWWSVGCGHVPLFAAWSFLCPFMRSELNAGILLISAAVHLNP